jgi:CheY-like chemotaxis protein
MLEAIPCQTGAAASSDAAIAMLREGAYDVVLLDWKMPEMNGVQTARQIFAGLAGSQLPQVIMLTAFNTEDLRLETAGLPIAGILAKPVSQSSLVDLLLRLQPPAPAPSSQPGVARVNYGLRGKHVLLVEDNPVNQQIARELLESVGVAVTVAANGRIALSLLDGDAGFDAVLMDLQMPELDGYDTTRAIRATPRHAQLPIIALTAHALPTERIRCLTAGMNDHIAKPVEPEVLFHVLARWIGATAPGTHAADTLAADFTITAAEPTTDRNSLLKPVDPESFKQALAALKTLLDAADSEAIDFFDAQRGLFEAGCSAADYAALDQLLRAYEFPAALAVADRILSSLADR